MCGHAHPPVAKWGGPLDCRLPWPAWQPSDPGQWSRASCWPIHSLAHWLSRHFAQGKGERLEAGAPPGQGGRALALFA